MYFCSWSLVQALIQRAFNPRACEPQARLQVGRRAISLFRLLNEQPHIGQIFVTLAGGRPFFFNILNSGLCRMNNDSRKHDSSHGSQGYPPPFPGPRPGGGAWEAFCVRCSRSAMDRQTKQATPFMTTERLIFCLRMISTHAICESLHVVTSTPLILPLVHDCRPSR